MKTEARTIRKTPGRLLAALLLTAALVMGMGISAAPAHAEITGGAYTLSGKYVVVENITTGVTESIPADKLQGTKFTLYKVGGFGRDEATGKSYLKLDDAFKTTPSPGLSDDLVNIEKGDKSDEEWIKAGLAAAQPVANAIAGDPSLVSEENTSTVTSEADGTFSFSGLSNGLYLLTGDTQEVPDYPAEGQSSYWTPQPMLVQVLNSNVEVQVKPVAENIRQFTLKKEWSGDDAVKDLVRPKQIKIEVLYDAKVVKTITLPDADNNWTAKWKAGKGQTDPNKWSVREVLSPTDQTNYYVNITWSDSGEVRRDYTVENVYSRKTLEIVKKTPIYHQVKGQTTPTTLVFELNGKDSSGKEVYKTKTGLQISSAGEAELEVTNIPSNVATMTVKEIYAGGNFKPVGDTTRTATYTPGTTDPETGKEIEPGKFSVEFENEYSGTPTSGSGIINQYKLQKDDYEVTQQK